MIFLSCCDTETNDIKCDYSVNRGLCWSKSSGVSSDALTLMVSSVSSF